MRRGDLYRVRRPGSGDPKRSRVFVVVSRSTLIESRNSTVICAPVYSRYDELSTQVRVGTGEGLLHDSCIHCDGLVSIPKALLTNYVGSLGFERLVALNRGLRVALALELSSFD